MNGGLISASDRTGGVNESSPCIPGAGRRVGHAASTAEVSMPMQESALVLLVRCGPLREMGSAGLSGIDVGVGSLKSASRGWLDWLPCTVATLALSLLLEASASAHLADPSQILPPHPLNRLTNLVWKLTNSTLASYAYKLGAAGNRTNLVELNGRTVNCKAVSS